MRSHNKLFAALLLPAMLAMSAAQGLLFMRCGESVRMSCCCPPEDATPPAATWTQAPKQCCDKLAVPNVPAQAHELAASFSPAPVLVAVLGAEQPALQQPQRVRDAPRLGLPPPESIVLTHCALLI